MDLLNLSTTLTRRVIKIDGTAYAMRHPDELSLTQQQALSAAGTILSKTFDADADPEHASNAEHRLREAVALLLPDLPPEVAERLTDPLRVAILQGFTRLAGQEGILSAPPGGGSSHDLPGSTGAAPAPGSASPPASSSGMST